MMDKTLDEIGGATPSGPQFGSHVATECHRLRRTPLKDFTIEDLRLMIGQGVGLEHLVPLALARLERDAFAAGDFYAGDLLMSVLGVGPGFLGAASGLAAAHARGCGAGVA